MNNSAEPTTRSVFRRVWPVLKWVLFVLVMLFVGRKAWQLWRDGDVGSVQVHWRWLLAACGLYVFGWLPSVLFWHRLIHGLHGTSSLLDVAHAFFAGHLGKYVPGKASVLLIRAGLLANRGCRPGVAALTSTYETLACMGVGMAVGLTLAPLVWPRDLTDRFPATIRPAFEHPLPFGLIVVAVCVVLVPVAAKLLGLIVKKLAPTNVTTSNETNGINGTGMSQPIRARFLLFWCFVFVATWLLHGASLGCTLRAVGVETSWSDWLTWTGDVSSASVLGFVAVFAPGGLGVREGVLISMLKTQPGISPSQAVAATALLRVVWLAGEILTAGGLAWIARKTKTSTIEPRA